MVTTLGSPPTDNFVAAWATEHGLRASGRWVEPEPEPVDEVAAYAPGDDQPADQSLRAERTERQQRSARDAVAAITGLDLDVFAPRSAEQKPPQQPEGRLQAVDTEDAPAPPQRPVSKHDSIVQRIGRVRRHDQRLAPSRTTAGRRDSYIRQKAQRLGITVDEARAITRKHPTNTRYGREQKAKRGAAEQART